MNLCLLMPLVLNPGNYFMPCKVNNDNFISRALKYHNIVVVITFSASKKSCGKGGNPRLMLILFPNSASYCVVLPYMNTLSDVSHVFCVLIVVDNQLATWVLKHVSVEKRYVLGTDVRVDRKESAVYFVNVVQRDLLTVKVVYGVCNVWAHETIV